MTEPKHDSSEQQAAAIVTSKKPYTAPALRIFGDVAALTRSVGNTGKADGGHGAMSKTA